MVDPEGAPEGIDRAELVSGASSIIGSFGAGLPAVNPGGWRPRKAARLVDEGDVLPTVETWSAGVGALLVDAIGEPPLLMLAGDVPVLGRWAEDAVMMLFGDGAGLIRLGEAVLEDSAPRLLALAGDEADIDVAIPALRDKLDGTGLVSLEAGLALEI